MDIDRVLGWVSRMRWRHISLVLGLGFLFILATSSWVNSMISFAVVSVDLSKRLMVIQSHTEGSVVLKLTLLLVLISLVVIVVVQYFFQPCLDAVTRHLTRPNDPHPSNAGRHISRHSDPEQTVPKTGHKAPAGRVGEDNNRKTVENNRRGGNAVKKRLTKSSRGPVTEETNGQLRQQVIETDRLISQREANRNHFDDNAPPVERVSGNIDNFSVPWRLPQTASPIQRELGRDSKSL